MRTPFLVMTLVAGSLVAAAGIAIAAQDRYALQVPNGIAFADFRGYDTWQFIATSKTDDGQKLMLGNPTAIAAYKDGAPAGGKAFADGSKIVKIEWSEKKMAASPYAVTEPDVLRSLSFMEKDSKRFASSGGWGYAQFKHDAASGDFTPTGTGSACGAACHTIVKARDYVFTGYPRR